MTIMKIVVFTEGTIFTHSNWLGLARAEILYLTSRRLPDEVQQVMEVLRRYSFPEGQLFSPSTTPHTPIY